MKRYERTRVLLEGDPDVLREIVHEVEQGEGAENVVVLDEPREELVMLQTRETAQGTLFFLGEALMTSCRVSIGDTVGYGFVLGSDRCRAYELAVVDAAFALDGRDEARARWEARLVREQGAISARKAAEAARIAATKVDFSTMVDGSADDAESHAEAAQAVGESIADQPQSPSSSSEA